MERTFITAMIVFANLISISVANEIEINKTLMLYTYRIEGPRGKEGEKALGTCFVMGIPKSDTPGKGQIVLITATHVLNDISGEKATIYIRKKISEGKYEKIRHDIQIRDGNNPLWVSHPKVDVAAIKVSLPSFVSALSGEMPLLSTELLANDEIIKKFEIHPGDELLCLGYPLGAEANPAGFPILRSGRIASYPLTPAEDINSFLFDFEVFEGNSGGPVYFVDNGRSYGGSIHLSERIQFIAGIVSEQRIVFQQSIAVEKSRDKTSVRTDIERKDLKIAVIVPAHFIKETLNLLTTK